MKNEIPKLKPKLKKADTSFGRRHIFNSKTKKVTVVLSFSTFHRRVKKRFLINSTQTKTFIYVIKLVTIVIKMMSLIKPGYWKILQLFYNDKSAKLHLREIARKAKLHEPDR